MRSPWSRLLLNNRVKLRPYIQDFSFILLYSLKQYFVLQTIIHSKWSTYFKFYFKIYSHKKYIHFIILTTNDYLWILPHKTMSKHHTVSNQVIWKQIKIAIWHFLTNSSTYILTYIFPCCLLYCIMLVRHRKQLRENNKCYLICFLF